MLEDTGERVIPENMSITNELLIEHIARYHFALPFITEGRVLDMASGSGFGTHIIAKKKKKVIEEVIGLDIDPDALAYAKKTYYHPKSSFHCADLTGDTLVDRFGSFNTIVSFETYEHIANESAFLTNAYNLLKPGGHLILSTPFGAGRGEPCGSPFHVHQITPDEFKALFRDFNYQQIDYFLQRGALIQRDDDQVLDHYPLGILVLKK
ncbi:2-polyprenyl-3-methyl-5-hydroxy-6-metoxy-1,4-benzoquinol methylase [Streptohalobacillus salinus]|uniref:2-polyprenyl-3-methyl-5-hydroxy-6-metoxy-1, 4-benzoquinol methylase n=1 Tax=Streptohalobacillus salinus TaxID=621096 RepID=A0A2V3W7R8_9BACI|nr:class I SAM-dependent methyltransferase [Streptohalobacillus salinus]PXW89208.1 2-polyprenyl-3-methyl-5-hydroxy-6-metoxy-1,4-benzoquinol methylase [Streptohalobacillus salinus]